MTDPKDDNPGSSAARKQELRAQAMASRTDLPNREELSSRILQRLTALPEYEAATRLSVYVGFASEVQTLPLLPQAWSQGKRVAVPCCVGDSLELYWVEDTGELASRTLGILEPKESIRRLPERGAAAAELDLIVVPGVAFDRGGGRIGYGKGYYDRLLQQAGPETHVVALAFECQLLPQVPMLGHDRFMDVVVTESAVCRRDAQ